MFSDCGRKYFPADSVRSDLDIWRFYDDLYKADSTRRDYIFYDRLHDRGAGLIPGGDGIDTGETGKTDKRKAVPCTGV